MQAFHRGLQADNGLKLFGLLTVGLLLRGASEMGQPVVPPLSPKVLAT